VTAALVGAALCCAANLPPEHGHPSDRDHHAIVHRHASLHVVRHASHPTLADDDGLIIWIDGSYVAGTSAVTAVPSAEISSVFSLAVDRTRPSVAREVPASAIHDPPRRLSGSRAPPRAFSL
jgi:hypothetical protein